MRFSKTLAVAGLAILLAGVTAVSAAERQPVHVMTVQLPGGGVEHIRYTGDVPPHVVLVGAAPAMADALDDGFLDTAFGPGSTFAAMEQISAEMDQQMHAMMQQAAAMQAMPDAQDAGLHEAALAGAPAGATSFTTVSTMTGSGICTRSVQVTAGGAGKAPQVVRKVSGDCGTAAAAQPPAVPAPAAPGPIARDSI